jgi:hypothetical protein
MSKENVLRFFVALTESHDLNVAAVKSPPQPEAWVALAKKNGFEFSDDELHDVVQASLGRNDLEKNATVEAFLAATRPVDELKDEQLDGVAGGTGLRKQRETQDKMGNFEIQNLMSNYNQAESLLSSVQKKQSETAGSIISNMK